MSFDTEFINSSAAPALVAINSPEWLSQARAMLTQSGYKVRAASNHEDFIARFSRTRYEIVVIEEAFSCSGIAENVSLYRMQNLSMAERRTTAVVLLGESFQTLNPREAYQQSVHAVANPAELDSLAPIVQQAVTNNGLFYEPFFKSEQRLSTGK